MRYFFIDLENVRSEGLEGVLSLREDDTVIIFYSENAMNISIPTLESINNSKAVKKYIKTNYIGKNAMDFQIVSLLGAMIERNKKGGYYIISKDNGFRSAVSFCESYFTEYDIMSGVYPTIIVAITDEMKRSVKNTDSGKKAAMEGKKGKKKKDNNITKSNDNKETAAENKEDNSAERIEPKVAPVASEEENSEQTVAKKKRRRRKSSKNKIVAADSNESENLTKEAESEGHSDSEDTAKTMPASTEEAKQSAPDYDYIYKTLAELLSDKTISLYAESIDEAIGKCKNKDELHEFFRNKYGEDEGEALYRVTQGDFEKMKQLRPAKAHKPGRHRHRSGHKHPAGNNS